MTQATTINVKRCRRWVQAQHDRVVLEIQRLGCTRGRATDDELAKLIAEARDYGTVLKFADEQFVEAVISRGWDAHQRGPHSVELTGDEYHPRLSEPRAHVALGR